jgi:L-ascorbate metabolism protein UlaG (beta-lactamase superfamily)
MQRTKTIILVCIGITLSGCGPKVAPVVVLPSTFIAPEQILYDWVPGFGAQGGTGILEWAQISAAPGSQEPVVSAGLNAPRGLRLRWLGAAGFEIADDDTAILLDPFVSRPLPIAAFLLQKLPVDTAAVEFYVTKPMELSGSLDRLKAILVSHTHHDHVQDVPYILSKFKRAGGRPLVAGDRNLLSLLRAYKGRESRIPWMEGVDLLESGSKAIFEFDKNRKLRPPQNATLGYKVGQSGQFGRFTITAFISEHGLYDDIPFTLEGNIRGKAPFTAAEYRAYLNSTMTYLIEYGEPGATKKFRIFTSDSARFLLPERVSAEVAQGGPIDILIQGIAARRKDNGIPEKIARLKPRYVVPVHYDNFFVPFDQFRAFDYMIKAPNDNSRLLEFIDELTKSPATAPASRLRMMKLFYYYSLVNLLADGEPSGPEFRNQVRARCRRRWIRRGSCTRCVRFMDAEQPQSRCMNVTDVMWLVNRLQTEVVCRAYDLAAPDSTARHQYREAPGIVIATGLFVAGSLEEGRATEFGGPYDEGLLQHAA